MTQSGKLIAEGSRIRLISAPNLTFDGTILATGATTFNKITGRYGVPSGACGGDAGGVNLTRVPTSPALIGVVTLETYDVPDWGVVQIRTETR